MFSITALLADHKKKIKLAHEIISANKKTTNTDQSSVTEKIPAVINVIPRSQPIEMQLNELYEIMETQKGGTAKVERRIRTIRLCCIA